MAIEIERKFLVTGEPWAFAESRVLMRQGYLQTGPPVSVRVRTTPNEAFLTLKGHHGTFSRLEFEYPIPLQDGNELIDRLCGGRVVEKIRYGVPWEGHLWEVDVFEGANAGLVVAELELDHEDDDFPRPPWLADEVTGDHRYLNSYLSQHPYTSWA